MKIDRGNVRHWLFLAQQGLLTLLIILIRPFRSKPNKPLVVLYGHQFGGNLKAIYTQWRQSHKDQLTLYILSMDPQLAQQLRHDGVTALQCNRICDMLTLTRASAVITDHGLHTMAPLTRFSDIKFIDVWHGIPFKGFIPKDFKLQHRYDEIWVSSPMIANLYCEKFGFEPARVKTLGYARTDQLFKAEKISHHSKKPNVLYAPTWQQDDQGRELFPFGESAESFLTTVAECCHALGATLMIRSHMNSEIKETSYPNVVFCSQRDYPDTENLLLDTDILICDWSSIAFDFLALDRPAIFLDVPPPFKNGLSLDAGYRFGKIVVNMEGLRSRLNQYLTHPEDYASEHGKVHERVRNAVYGNNTDGKCAIRQLDRLLELTVNGTLKAE